MARGNSEIIFAEELVGREVTYLDYIGSTAIGTIVLIEADEMLDEDVYWVYILSEDRPEENKIKILENGSNLIYTELRISTEISLNYTIR